MSDKDFEQMLRDLREQYLEKEEITEEPLILKKVRFILPFHKRKKDTKYLNHFIFLKRRNFSCLKNSRISISKMPVTNKYRS